ncbi:PPE family protein [Mycobacterium arosiense]|uniref:PPE family protein n=1 Tax=Mycobacterium arosiense TaxID=425468 RepID=UPI001FE380F7|nr:PPE family protein [Mycobacterium arosiense]
MLAPEIISARMYSGPGSASMSLAAEAWDEMALSLYGIAQAYRSAISTPVRAPQRSAATVIAESAVSYIGWLNDVAAQAQRTAAQARAAVDAFESALAAVVAPSVIHANRALRMSLVATNCLAQNGPAIADTEADYQQMWAQDADAMYAYAAASQAASTVMPLRSPPAIVPAPGDHGAAVTEASDKWSLIAAPQIVSAGCHVMRSIPPALEALSLSPLTTLTACLSAVTSPLSKLGSLSDPSNVAISHLSFLHKAASLETAAALMSDLSQSRGTRPALSARLGRGVSIGKLSVPPSWDTATTPASITYKPLDHYRVIDPSEFEW